MAHLPKKITMELGYTSRAPSAVYHNLLDLLPVARAAVAAQLP